jgi:hypothetical protein
MKIAIQAIRLSIAAFAYAASVPVLLGIRWAVAKWGDRVRRL